MSAIDFALGVLENLAKGTMDVAPARADLSKLRDGLKAEQQRYDELRASMAGQQQANRDSKDWTDAARQDIARLEAELAQLRTELDYYKARTLDHINHRDDVMSERCPPNAWHCSCVPVLRNELAQLREAVASARELLKHPNADAFLTLTEWERRDAWLAKHKEAT